MNKFNPDIKNIIHVYCKPLKYLNELKQSIQYISFDPNLYKSNNDYYHPVIKNQIIYGIQVIHLLY